MDLMKEAGLNTLLGMGMTFLVLITLSLIISLFGKILNGAFDRKKTVVVMEKPKGSASPAPVKAAPAAVDQTAQEPGTAQEDDPALMAVIAGAVAAYESSDIPSEVVAVIAAAVAASEEGSGHRRVLIPGASGFAVRKIRKSRSRVA